MNRWRHLGASIAITSRVALLCPDQAVAQDSRSDAVTEAQGAGGFNSLTDGQPGTAGAPELSLTGGALGNSEFAFECSIALTPRVSYLYYSLFGLVVPTLEVGEGATDFERSVSITWLQRWTYERRMRPTFATQLALQVPFDEPNAEIDAVFTVVLARGLGPCTVYLNAYGETTEGINTDEIEWGALLGCKASFTSSFFLVGDVFLQTDSVMTIEMSPVYELPFGLSIGPGPGAQWNLCKGEASINFGLALQYSREQ
jgi:hypothetical protein